MKVLEALGYFYFQEDFEKISAVNLDLKKVKLLESLKILENGGAASDSDKEKQLIFTEKQIELLSKFLVKGLIQAKANQDIIFALEKTYSRLLGLKTDRLFVAGRVFYKDDKLNIIIGDYDRARDEGVILDEDDERPHAVVAGREDRPVAGRRVLLQRERVVVIDDRTGRHVAREEDGGPGTDQ